MPKTTAVKTKPHRSGRVVWIYRDNPQTGRLIAVRRATSLKSSLQDYFKEVLEPRGYHDPIYTGNMITVTFRKQNSANYVAAEAK